VGDDLDLWMRYRRGPEPQPPPPKSDPLRMLQDRWNGLSRWRRFWYGTGLLIIAMWILSLVKAPALADPVTTFHDASGRITGTSTTSPNGVTTFRDRQGRMSGTATRDANGTVTYRDGSGRMTGSATAPRR
jgi:RHS Repeat